MSRYCALYTNGTLLPRYLGLSWTTPRLTCGMVSQTSSVSTTRKPLKTPMTRRFHPRPGNVRPRALVAVVATKEKTKVTKMRVKKAVLTVLQPIQDDTAALRRADFKTAVDAMQAWHRSKEDVALARQHPAPRGGEEQRHRGLNLLPACHHEVG